MNRIQIELPDVFDFRTLMDVRITDINYGGHLGNDSVLSLIHEARVRFFLSLGVSESDIGGTGIIMSDASIVFKSESFYGDCLAVSVAVGGISTSSFDLFYLIEQDEARREVARAKTGIVCFDYSARRIRPIPASFLAVIHADGSFAGIPDGRGKSG